MTPGAPRLLLFTILLGWGPAIRAQEQETSIADRIAAVDAAASKALVAFGKRAEGQKAHRAARRAYTLVVDLYDAEQPVARRGLGWKKKGNEWTEPTAGDALPPDGASASQLRSIDKLWEKTCLEVGRSHKQLGVALCDEGHLAPGLLQLEHALHYLPDDRECHTRLGHEEFDGFFGTSTEVGFARRLRELIALGQELRERRYDVEPLPAARMPQELQATGLDFRGARSKHFEHWVVDDQEAAAQTLQWAERCHDLLRQLLGTKARNLDTGALRWLAILRSDQQRDQMFARSPITTGEYTVDQARLFGGSNFEVRGGRAAVVWHIPPHDADYCVAHVTKYHYLGGGRNVGLGEGLVHAMTWLLCGTTETWFAALPKTVAGGLESLPRVPAQWLERLQDEIERGADWQLEQLPRERSDNFRDSARIKSWSFLVWLIAREPERWHRIVDAVSVADLTPELVAKKFAEVLERPIAEVDAEWRAFARRGSPLGRVSGWQ